jgi:hypothetical protein
VVIGKTKAKPGLSRSESARKKPKRAPWPRVPTRPPAHLAWLKATQARVQTAHRRLEAGSAILADFGFAPQHAWRLQCECARDAALECLEWLEDAVALAIAEPEPNPIHPQGSDPAQKRRARAARAARATADEEPTSDELAEVVALP